MVAIKCETCDDITIHLIIWKGDAQYWQCQECKCSDIPVLTCGNGKTGIVKNKKNMEPLTVDDIEPYHGYQSGTDTPCIHCGGRYVSVDIVQIPADKSNDGTGFVNIITCECGRVVNGAECRDVLNAVDKDGIHGRVSLGLGVLAKTMEDDYNDNVENRINSESAENDLRRVANV